MVMIQSSEDSLSSLINEPTFVLYSLHLDEFLLSLAHIFVGA